MGAVLAGGLSRRFGGNKLLHPVDGKPMIARVIEALRESGVEGVVVVTRPGVEGVGGLGADRLIFDFEGLGCSGPPRGLASLALAVGGTDFLIVPGDIPWIRGETLGRLIDHARGVSVASPYYSGNGFVETLIAYASSEALRRVAEACRARGGMSRGTDLHRGAHPLKLVATDALTTDLREFVSVDRRETLADPRPRGSPSSSSIVFSNVHSDMFWRGTRALKGGGSSPYYELEAGEYLREGVYYLAYHAYIEAYKTAYDGGRRRRLASKLRWLEAAMGWRNKI